MADELFHLRQISNTLERIEKLLTTHLLTPKVQTAKPVSPMVYQQRNGYSVRTPEVGATYNLTKLQFISWYDLGVNLTGYNWRNYFQGVTSLGRYLGEDAFHVQPLFTKESLDAAFVSA